MYLLGLKLLLLGAEFVFGWPFGCIVEFGDLGLCWSVLYACVTEKCTHQKNIMKEPNDDRW